MGELMELSIDLNVITAEINSYKNVAGQAIFEIGRRLKHVKENDLAHGEFGKWLESIEINHRVANQMMKVAKELPNSSTYSNLSSRVLYEIATLPEEERIKTHEIPSTGEQKTVDEMTVRELKEVKKALKEAEEAKHQAETKAERAERREQIALKQLEAAENKPTEVIVKEIVKEVVPETVKKQLQEKDRMLAAIKRDSDQLQEELNILKLQVESPGDEERAMNKLKRLEMEADITVLSLKLETEKFLKEVAVTPLRKGAIAASTDKNRTRLSESVEALESFCKDMRIALTGRIKQGEL